MEIRDKLNNLNIYLLPKFLYCCVLVWYSSEISEYIGCFLLIFNTGAIPLDRGLLWVLAPP
jgi:hypothetical protein